MTILCLKVNDSIQLDLASNKVQDIIKFEVREKQKCPTTAKIAMTNSIPRLETCAW